MTSQNPTKATPSTEGLAPCFRMVVYEDRRALMHDSRHEGGSGFHLAATYFKGHWIEAFRCGKRPGVLNYPASDMDRPSALIAFPESEIEAEAAWERAEHWVRTGELS